MCCTRIYGPNVHAWKMYHTSFHLPLPLLYCMHTAADVCAVAAQRLHSPSPNKSVRRWELTLNISMYTYFITHSASLFACAWQTEKKKQKNLKGEAKKTPTPRTYTCRTNRIFFAHNAVFCFVLFFCCTCLLLLLLYVIYFLHALHTFERGMRCWVRERWRAEWKK